MALDQNGKLIEDQSSSGKPYLAIEKGINARRMVLIDKNTGNPVNMQKTVKDSWSGNVDITKTWASAKSFISISNDGSSAITFVINGITITVDVGESFAEHFDPFTSVQITAASAYRAYVKD